MNVGDNRPHTIPHLKPHESLVGTVCLDHLEAGVLQTGQTQKIAAAGRPLPRERQGKDEDTCRSWWSACFWMYGNVQFYSWFGTFSKE